MHRHQERSAGASIQTRIGRLPSLAALRRLAAALWHLQHSRRLCRLGAGGGWERFCAACCARSCSGRNAPSRRDLRAHWQGGYWRFEVLEINLQLCRRPERPASRPLPQPPRPTYAGGCRPHRALPITDRAPQSPVWPASSARAHRSAAFSMVAGYTSSGRLPRRSSITAPVSERAAAAAPPANALLASSPPPAAACAAWEQAQQASRVGRPVCRSCLRE